MAVYVSSFPYRLAADSGAVDAQFNVGQRITKARVFHRTTKKPCGGNAGAGKNCDLSARKMTPCQIAEAQRLAREWKPVQK